VPPPTESRQDRRLTVVLVDEDEAFVDSLRTVVDRQPGLSVAGVARDGQHALELVVRETPQAVLIDLHMTLLDGVSAVARLRQEHPALCVIAMADDASGDLHDAAEAAGADAVVMKDELVPQPAVM
jgi:DNA-binding NarL/FixJ family response regulator